MLGLLATGKSCNRWAAHAVFLGWALLLALPSWGQVVPHRAPHVPWLEDLPWPVLVSQAEAAKQPILIDFYAQWCGPCKALDAMVYNEAEVIGELKDVTTFKVDVDKPQYAELKQQFDITRLPTLIWCESDGTPLFQFTGYVSADTFLTRIRAWKTAQAVEHELLARLASSPDDPSVLLAAYRQRMREGRSTEAAEYRGRLLGLTTGARRHEATGSLLSIAAQDTQEGDLAGARELARRIGAMFPLEGIDLGREVRRRDLESLEHVARFQEQLADTLGLLDTYNHMIDLDRGSMVALVGFAQVALSAGIRLPQATTCALRAVIRSDNQADLIALLAACYERRQFYPRAVSWMEKAVVKDPENESFKSALARYRASCPPWLRGSP